MKTSTIMQHIDLVMEKVAMTDSMRAVREGLLWLVPCLLVSETFLLASSILDLLQVWPDLSSALLAVNRALTELTPLLVAASIGYMLSIKQHLPRAPIAFLCLSYAAVASSILSSHSRAALAFVLIIAIILPLLVLPALRQMQKHRWPQLATGDIAGEKVKSVINLILPGIVLGIVVAGMVTLLTLLPGFDNLLNLMTLDIEQAPYQSGIIVAFLNSSLWFFGIHGYHALLPIFDHLDAAVPLAQAAITNGDPPSHLLNSAFLGAFVFIGGSGATLSLTFAMLLLCKNKDLRLLAAASLPIAMANVNEILLFALPIILNPRLLIPFITVPIGNLIFALAATESGLVAPATVLVPLNSPIGVNAFIATGGDPGAIALQLICVVIGLLIYAPFVQHIDAQTAIGKTIHLRSLDTTYTQLHEHAALYAIDPIINANSARNRQAENEMRLEELSDWEFYLVYQPQVCRDTRRFTGCEALLRCRDNSGRERTPASFLPWLAQGKLMKQVDLWVAQTASQQYREWLRDGLDIHITINITGASLMDKDVCAAIIRQIRHAAGRISVEITEESLADDVDAVQAAIHAFHAIGAKVYIDDFGTGFSSLGYLHRFAVDAIKIDRSFVLALGTEKGRSVMRGVLDFAKALKLRTVIEGIETNEQLSEIDTEYSFSVQGWLFSKALKADALPGFIHQLEGDRYTPSLAPKNHESSHREFDVDDVCWLYRGANLNVVPLPD